MQLGHTKLSEREKRHSERLCYYFGKPGHFVQQCPLWARTSSKWDPDEWTNTSTRFSMVSPFHSLSHQAFTLPVQIRYSDVVSVLAALIDSGSTRNFIDQATEQTKHSYSTPATSSEHPCYWLGTHRKWHYHTHWLHTLRPSFSKSLSCIRNTSHSLSLSLWNTRLFWGFHGCTCMTLKSPGLTKEALTGHLIASTTVSKFRVSSWHQPQWTVQTVTLF